jgi:tRNA dimethylallyltransferase
LLKQNQEVALKLGVNNRRRNIRALQIINNKEPFRQKNKLHYDCFLITCFIERQKLYDKINTNVDLMIKNGWKNEIETLYQRDKNIDALNAFKAIGYSDILNSIVTNKNIDIEKIKQKTRQYAKRQLS